MQLTRVPKKLPVVLSAEEVEKLIATAPNIRYRTILLLLYATGLRRAEAAQLKIADIDSQRMVIHVHAGKNSRDRELPPTPKLLDVLRAYWRACKVKPKVYLFATRFRRQMRRGRSPIKRYGMPVARVRAAPGYRNASARIRFAILLRPTSSKVGPICRRCNS